MIMKNLIRISLTLFFVTSLFLIGSSQTFNVQDKIPINPDIRIGKLDNGMTYYLRKNAKPENKVDFRLVIKVGSIMEDKDQLGLAHFTEHMCFNGSKNFKKNELVDYLQSIGVKFGAHLNAYTSFDETVYILPIPVDDDEKLEKGLQILEDWAHQVSFEGDEIDKERGVVLEEYRLRKGAGERMSEKYLPKLLYKSRYAERLPIGKKEILEEFEYEAIKRFYKDWYRPDLMAIVAVGDMDVDEMEKKVKAHFSRIQPIENPKKRIKFDVPNHKETLVAIESDKEASSTSVSIYYKMLEKENPVKTVGDYRKGILHELFSGMIGNRLNELCNSEVPPFIYAYSSYGSFIGDGEAAYTSIAAVAEDGVMKGLKTLLEENERVKRFGFTQGEFDRIKKSIMSGLERQFKEKDKRESGRLTRELVSNFLDADPIPGISWEYAYYKKFLPEIKLEEVNALIKKWIIDENRVIIVTGPEKEGLTLATEEEILELVNNLDKLEIKAYKDKIAGTVLMSKIPEKGKVVSTSNDEKLGIKTLMLSNGAKVIIKKTDFKNDEVLMSAYSNGGTSLYSDEEYDATHLASGVMSQNGLNGYSQNDLNKLLAGKIARVFSYVSSLREGISASSSVNDLETMFQRIYLNFTATNKDEKAYNSYVTKTKAYFNNILANPEVYFQIEMLKLMSPNDKRAFKIPSDEDWAKTDYDIQLKKHKERFANAGDFNFYFVGSFDEAKLIALIETYIASLPGNTAKKEQWKDLGVRSPKGVIEKRFFKGSDEKSSVRITFTGETTFSFEQKRQLEALGELLSIKLVENLREEKSGVYGVSARGTITNHPYENYTMTISFPCGPENVDELIKAARNEVKKIIENGPTQEDVDKVKEAQIKSYEENIKKNRFWLSSIENTDFMGLDSYRILKLKGMIGELTVKSIQKTAQKYLQEDNLIIGVLMPEAEKGK